MAHLTPGSIGGGQMGEDEETALSFGFSHTAAHSQHDSVFMYGQFMRLKGLHSMKYSL